MIKFISTIILTSIIIGQESSREIGLGGVMVTLSRGVEAVGVNPANLGFSNPSISLLNFNTSIYNNLLSLEVYNNINGADLENPNSPLTKTELFDILNGNSFDLFNQLNLNIPGINYSNNKYALSTRLRQITELKTGNGLFKTLLFGNEWETEIPIEFEANLQTVIEYAISSWFKLDGFSIGYTLKYLQGVNLFKLYSLPDNKPLYTDSTGIDMSFYLGRELYPGGSGLGIDVGIATEESNSGFSIGLSIVNIFGYINWDKHNLNYSLFGKQLIENSDLSAFKTEVVGLEINNLNASDLMSGTIELADSVFSDSTFTQNLETPILKTDYPSILRFGLSKKFDDNYYLAYESRTGFQDNSVKPVDWVHSIGVEIIRWKIIPLRFGLSSGDKFNHKFSFGSGIHINPIKFDFGIAWIGSRKIYTANGLEFGMSFTLGF